MVEKSWCNSHGGEGMVKQSWLDSQCPIVMVEKLSWKTHGGMVTLDHSFNINGGTVMVERLW